MIAGSLDIIIVTVLGPQDTHQPLQCIVGMHINISIGWMDLFCNASMVFFNGIPPNDGITTDSFIALLALMLEHQTVYKNPEQNSVKIAWPLSQYFY